MCWHHEGPYSLCSPGILKKFDAPISVPIVVLRHSCLSTSTLQRRPCATTWDECLTAHAKRESVSIAVQDAKSFFLSLRPSSVLAGKNGGLMFVGTSSGGALVHCDLQTLLSRFSCCSSPVCFQSEPWERVSVPNSNCKEMRAVTRLC